MLTRSIQGLVVALAVGVSMLEAAEGDPPFLVGACTHFAQAKGDPPRNLQMMVDAGVRSLRDEVYWSGIERERGKLEMPEAWDRYVQLAFDKGIRTLMLLGYGNALYDGGGKPVSDEARAAFVRYSQFVVDRFKGRIPYYEVWNRFAAVCHPAIRSPCAARPPVDRLPRYPSAQHGHRGADQAVAAMACHAWKDRAVDQRPG
jgi:beta-glucosidase/6-phospho-beta-glucosidase/beta-galactosidase